MIKLFLGAVLLALSSYSVAMCAVMTSSPPELTNKINGTSAFGQDIFTRYDAPNGGIADRDFADALKMFTSNLASHQAAECAKRGATTIINMDIDFDVDFEKQRYFFLATYDFVSP
ncbi:hypothetical protein [Zhongshania marina]|uniref:Uncharacterized protein n=1 Tax=Zhongshania marina TaxID=2304603 RepID=A0A2S4HC67_9GAMM|nr:hypothetical protein [Marortus luteolus]POP51529.1 hypothetical protein C0068_16460 [Marortus luteolus]